MFKQICAAFAALSISTLALAGNGRVIAMGDEWLLSDKAFTDQAVQTQQLADNVALFFTDGSPSRLLVLSDAGPIGILGNRGFLGNSLKNRMLALGHTWEVNPPGFAFTVAALRNYRGVFLCGNPGSGSTNASILEAYVATGGNVMIMAGTGLIGDGSANAEAGAWNPFLVKFGLSFGTTYFAYRNQQNFLINISALPSTNPLGESITLVQWGNGQSVIDLQPENPLNEIALVGNFVGTMVNPPPSPHQAIIGTVNITSKCLGDFNLDGFVDDADFIVFVFAYNLLVCNDPAMPAGCPADLNGDTFVDDIDFTIFVQSYDLPVCL